MKALKPEEDERLLIEAAQQDPRRFAELYEHNFHRVYAYVSRRVQSREEAEDVTSDVFHQALAKIKSFEWRGAPFSAWLIRIARNALVDRWKRSSKESADSFPDLPDQAAFPEVERRASLFRLVERLPDDQRRVVVERFVEQKSIRDIAQGLGKSEGAVKQLQFRALEKLRAQMEGANG